MKTFVIKLNVHGIEHEQSIHLEDMVGQMTEAVKVETVIEFISLIDIENIDTLKPFQVAVLKSKMNVINKLLCG